MNLAENNRRKMKLLILCALVAVAAAGYQPSEAAGDKLCLMCGDPVVRSFDGKYGVVSQSAKTLMVRSLNKRDHCKIDIHVVTHDNYFGSPDPSQPNPNQLLLDWVGIGYWLHKNYKKEFRNWVFGQTLDYLIERGQGFDEPVCKPLPHDFPFTGEILTDLPWANGVDTPSDIGCGGEPVYTARKVGNSIQMRSKCCGWAIDWYPKTWDTCINIWAVKADSEVVYPNMEDGNTKGVCGNMNGDVSDDMQMCDGSGSTTSYSDFANSCRDSKHEAQAYPGGAKLTSICTTITPIMP